MVSLHCPFCHKHTSVDAAPLRRMDSALRSGAMVDQFLVYVDGPLFWWLGRCNACSMPMLIANMGKAVYPAPQPAPVDKRIPELIAKDLEEAARCMTVMAFNGASVLARRALQSACVEHGATGGRLVDQIKSLLDQGIITKAQYRMAHGIRCVGNEGAHESKLSGSGDLEIIPVSEEDARAIIGFAEEFCRSLYSFPAEVDGQLEKRGLDEHGKKKKL